MKTIRILGVLLSAAITLCAVTGCGRSEDTADNPIEVVTTKVETEPTTQAENNVQYDEVVLYQTPSCKITFSGIDTESTNLSDHLIITYIAENIGNEKISFDCTGVIINGFEMNDMLGGNESSLEPGRKSAENIFISRYNIEDAHIEKIETVELIGYVFLDNGGVEDLSGDGLKFDPPYEIIWKD